MFLTVSGRWKSKIKVPEEAVCDENSLCGLWTVSFSWCPHMAQGEHCESELVLFLGAPPSWPNHFPMAPTLFRMLSLWRVGFQHMSVGGHKHSIHLTTSNSSSLDSYPGCIRESCWICPYYIVAVSISFLSLFNTFFLCKILNWDVLSSYYVSITAVGTSTYIITLTLQSELAS